MGPVVFMRRFADLTDVTLVDEDTNSIPTNNANRTIQDNALLVKREMDKKDAKNLQK